MLPSWERARRWPASPATATFAPEALELLAAAWPGNARQLFNVVERCVALAPSRVIGAALVRKCLGETATGLAPFDEARDEFTRNDLRQMLELSSGNIGRAARLAHRNCTDFYKLLSPLPARSGAVQTGGLRMRRLRPPLHP
ncbi:MAG: hypothetical protein QM661_01300 [Solimonas sp.]